MAATKAYNELGGYCDPDLNGALQTILAAFEEEDAEGAKEALNRPCLKDLVKIKVVYVCFFLTWTPCKTVQSWRHDACSETAGTGEG